MESLRTFRGYNEAIGVLDLPLNNLANPCQRELDLEFDFASDSAAGSFEEHDSESSLLK